MTMRAPDEAGTWEIRYLSGGDRTTFARTTFEVETAEASVSAPASVLAGEPFVINWTGPENDGDYITIVEPDTPERRYGAYQHVEDTGDTVTMNAPDEAGTWEIRYLSGGGRTTFARTTFEVEAADDD